MDSVDNSMQPCILSTDSMSGIEDDVLDSSKHSEMDNNIHNTNLILISTPLSVLNPDEEISSSLSRIESIDFTESVLFTEASIQCGSASEEADNDKIEPSTGLKVLYTNIDSYLNKREELIALVQKLELDLICMVEIDPKFSKFVFHQSEYDMEGYHSYYSNSKKRGVVIMVRKHLVSSSYEKVTKYAFEEVSWITINLKNKDRLVIGCIYRYNEENNNHLINLLENIQIQDVSHLLIDKTGDFPCKDIDWMRYTTPLDENTIQAKLIDLITESGWHQHVKSPTRFRLGQQPSLLDLMITNEANMINNLQLLSPIGKSDHCVVIFDYVSYRMTGKAKSIPRYYLGDLHQCHGSTTLITM